MIGLAASGGFYKIVLVTLVLAVVILAGCLALERVIEASRK